MATLKIYGMPKTRTYRTLWMAQELGLDYELVPVNFTGGETKTPAYLAINPNGHIPAIDDDGVRLFESMAINLYLAKKHGGDLAPRDVVEDGHMTMWSFWVMTEVEHQAMTVLFHAAFLPPEKRDPAKVAEAGAKLAGPLKVLDDALLAGGGHLVGGRFSVADLNVASVVSYLRAAPQTLAAFANVQDWLTACVTRPAAKAANQVRVEAKAG
jgi:glutathione S-transferase